MLKKEKKEKEIKKLETREIVRMVSNWNKTDVLQFYGLYINHPAPSVVAVAIFQGDGEHH